MDRLGPNSANSSPLTPLDFIERTAIVYGDRPSVVYNQKVYTWSETYRRCLRLASALSSHFRISSADVVSVLAPNIPAMYEMHFGVPMSGAILNTINIRLDARTVSVLLRHSGSRLLFVDPLSLPLARSALALLPADHRPHLIPIEDPFEDACDLIGFDLSYEKLLDLGDPEFRWIRPTNEWSPMILNYTSGTTSAPKGVVHSHRGIFIVSVDSLINWSVPHHPVYLWTLPMFHANGWCFPWGIASVAGTNVCLRRFDGPSVFDAIADNRVTHLCGAPVVLNMLANSPPTARRALPGTVQIQTAGAPPPAAVLARVEALGFAVSHGYGLTETAGLVTSCAWKGEHWDRLPAAERARMKARQGVRTQMMSAIDVVDGATARSVPWDGATMGEVVLRGGHVMMGYLKDEDATAKAIKDGWFYTGDVGVMHPDGYLEIKDRSKDLIISGGENISSVEVESLMYGHPAVNEAAVVARPDEYWGETPCAFVALKAGLVGPPPTEAELIAWCRDKMTHYMVPKMVVFLSELPKTSTGKIQKYVLRNIAKKLGPLSTGAGKRGGATSVQSRHFRKVVVRQNRSTVAKVIAKTVNQPVLALPASTYPVLAQPAFSTSRCSLKISLSRMDSSKPAPGASEPVSLLSQAVSFSHSRLNFVTSPTSTYVTPPPVSFLSRPWTPSADPVRIRLNNRLRASSLPAHCQLIANCINQPTLLFAGSL